jgi:hypothetical protein
VPVATRTHSGQSTHTANPSGTTRNSAKDSGRGLHSVSNRRVRTHDRLLDALADTTRRLAHMAPAHVADKPTPQRRPLPCA